MKRNFDIIKKQIDVSCETLDKLAIYFDLLCFWQKKMNLVSNNSLLDAVTRHFLDSAQLYSFCRKFNGNKLDFGSGAGFPGAVLSILGISKIFLIESRKNKCDFLTLLKKETNSNFNIINSRIENLQFLDPSLIISRALTSTKNLIILTINHMLKSESIKTRKEARKKIPNLLFLKGKSFQQELNDVPANLNIKFQIFPSVTSVESRILLYSNNII
tara:strand:- start:744 stop:1391 length:648 start_codon:yes stop_codon:yes gene_type:complete